MRKITLLLLFAIMAFTFNGWGQVFMTELADPNNNANARYIELYNIGASDVDFTEGSGWLINKFTNGSATVSQTLNLTGTILAGDFYVIAYDNSAGTFLSVYGFEADQLDPVSNGVAGGNGDDILQLVDGTGTVVDFYGVQPHADLTSSVWEYEDGRAERAVGAAGGLNPPADADWTTWSDGPGGNYPGETKNAPDDFDPAEWIGASAGTGPIISMISTDPPSESITSVSAVSVSANITDDGTISSAYLQWGTATGVLTNTIAMELDEDPTYITETLIPAQTVGTTVYYKVFSEDNDTEVSESDELSYTVLYPAATGLSYNQTFDADLGSCYVYSVSGAIKKWEHASYGGNGYANMNGYESASGELQEDWLIIPAVNFDMYSNERMTFDTWYNYGVDEDADNYLHLMWSSDYMGYGDPTLATWTEISFDISGSANDWASSGMLDLSGITGTNVHLAFKYNYQIGDWRWWQVDNLAIYEAEFVDVTFQVNMEEQTVSANGIHVAGEFNSWTADATPMLDPEMDGIYEVTVSLISGLTYEFKYINGNAWGTNGVDQEIVPLECQASGSDNRFVVVGETSFTIDPVCFGSCNDCGFVAPTYDVTFQVDMQNETVAGVVNIAGSFTGWSDVAMTNVGGHIWEITYNFDEGSALQYKFKNGGDWEPGADREFSVPSENTVLDLVCYGSSEHCPAVGFVMINETDADTDGTDLLEFIELYDGGMGYTPLSGLVVVLYNGSDDASYNAFDLDGYITDANGYFLMGNVDVVPTPDLIFPSNTLQNGADAVSLYVGNDTDFPNDTPVTDVNLVDAIVYDTGDGDNIVLLDVLTPGQPQVDEQGRGNGYFHSNQRIPNGTGGLRMTYTYDQSPPTPKAENVGLYSDWTGAIDNAWSNDGNWSNIVPDATMEVLIPVSPNDPYIIENNKGTSYFAYCMSLNIQSGASLTIASNSNLTVSGLLVNDGSLTLESEGDAASLINNTPGVSADIEREYNIDMVDWHLVSSPVEEATAAVFDGFYLQGYVEADNANAMYGYYEITELGHLLNPFEGYAFFPGDGSPGKVTFSGVMNQDPIPPATLTAVNPDPEGNGWNLLGNPYPCSIDWDMVTISPNMKNEVHYIDAVSGDDLTYVQFIGGPGSRYIPPMQGFFVSATGSETFSIDNTVKTHNGSNEYYKSEIEELLILKALGNEFSDETWIHFNENAGVEHDGIYDGHKRISSSNPELPQIFSITPAGKYLSVNGIPAMEMVPVGFKAGQSGEFTIEAIETGIFTTVILKDEFTGIETDLLNDSYTFNYNTNDADHRFNIHFASLAVSENIESLFNVYAHGNEIIVASKSFETNAQISVFNVMGQEIASAKLDGTVSKLKVENNAVYIVKVVSEKGVVSKKVYIK